MSWALLWILAAMASILTVAAVVVAYVAFVRRGLEVPAAPWLGDLLERGVAALPTLDSPTHDRVGR